jgi:hypothetical protein
VTVLVSWKKGGRLYSSGEHCYQRLSETERLKMTIKGEPVAEIDIKASFLTISVCISLNCAVG